MNKNKNKFLIEKPTIFYTIEELEEAIALGYIPNCIKYYLDATASLPTMFWKEIGGEIEHQSNLYHDINRWLNNVWSEKRYIHLLQNSIDWENKNG